MAQRLVHCSNWDQEPVNCLVSNLMYFFQNMAPFRSKVLVGCLLVLVSAAVLVEAEESADEATVEVSRYFKSSPNASVNSVICYKM